MNTLRPQEALARLRSHEPLSRLLSRLAEGPYPVDICEAEGPFAAFIAAEASRAAEARGCGGPLLAVVPTDQEAESLASDLSILGQEATILPWWRVAAYRPASPRARVFGERAACLSRLCRGTAPIVVASQRAFVTPLPPRKSFEPLSLLIERGGSIDPTELGERLASYGYFRVPRVSLPGEFALRGEVLDLFMPGDEEALRVVFEYDKIEKISSFDPGLQSSSGKLETAIIRPMKEIIWDEAKLARLAEVLPSLPGIKGREAKLLEELAEKGEAKGEEFYYPLVFEKTDSVLDYLGPDCSVFFFDHERLEAQEEAARKEYAGLYRRALQEGPVPPPDRMLHSFIALESEALAAPRKCRVARSFALKDTGKEGRIAMGGEQPRSFFGNVQYFKDELATLLKAGYGVIVFAETDMQRAAIRAFFWSGAEGKRRTICSASRASAATRPSASSAAGMFARSNPTAPGTRSSVWPFRRSTPSDSSQSLADTARQASASVARAGSAGTYSTRPEAAKRDMSNRPAAIVGTASSIPSATRTTAAASPGCRNS